MKGFEMHQQRNISTALTAKARWVRGKNNIIAVATKPQLKSEVPEK
jgi:hypothetical protein